MKDLNPEIRINPEVSHPSYNHEYFWEFMIVLFSFLQAKLIVLNLTWVQGNSELGFRLQNNLLLSRYLYHEEMYPETDIIAIRQHVSQP